MTAAEARGPGIGRVRIGRVTDASAHSSVASVVPGATIVTDDWPAYLGVLDQGYDHRVKSVSRSGDPAYVVMPRVHRIASLLDRWWLGTHHGSMSRRHPDYYLDEFTLRFNHRTSSARGLLFYRLLSQAVDHEPVSLAGLVGGSLERLTTSSG